MYLGAEVATTSRDTLLVRELHALAVAISQAKDRNDTIGAQRLLDRFRVVAEEYRSRGATDLNAVDRLILQTGQWIQDSTSAAGGLIRDTARLVGETVGAVAGAVTKPLLPALWPIALGLVAVAFIMGGGFRRGIQR